MIEDAAQQFGVEVQTTAEEALLGALRRATGYVMYYRARVAELQRDAHVQGTERITREARPNPNGPGILIQDTTVAKTVTNEYLRLLAHWEAQQFRVAAKIAELQIEVGKVKLLQEQAELFYDRMIRTLELFGISRDDDRIPEIIPRVMGEIV